MRQPCGERYATREWHLPGSASGGRFGCLLLSVGQVQKRIYREEPIGRPTKYDQAYQVTRLYQAWGNGTRHFQRGILDQFLQQSWSQKRFML